MKRHRIDTSTPYSMVASHEEQPEYKEIEVAEVDTIEELAQPELSSVPREPYDPDPLLVKAVDLAQALGRPLLLQGNPGCGKTRLAYAVAYAFGLPLEECYIKSTSRAQDLLYTYDAINRLYEAQLGTKQAGKNDDSPRSLDIRRYIHPGPLGRAIIRAALYQRRSVVLIDEIDKADLDFPNDLLLELDRLEFRITETTNMHFAIGDRPELRPIVIVTHNEEKPLPAAFLRRCIFHYLRFPKGESHLENILSLHDVANEELSKKAIEILQKLRSPDLNLIKKPGLSELLDWVIYLEARKVPVEDLAALPYPGALLKQQSDLQRAKEAFHIEQD